MTSLRDNLARMFGAQMWREAAYILIAFGLGIAGFVYTITVISLGAGLAVTVVGLIPIGLLILAGRGWNATWRYLANELLGEQIEPPPAFVRPQGFWRMFGASLTDITGWRAMLFNVIAFALGLAAFIVSVTLFAIGAGGATFWIWARFLPAQTMHDGTQHRAVFFNTGHSYWAVTGFWQFLLVAMIGLVVCALWVVANRGLTNLFRLTSRGLLGPTAWEVRVARLRVQRAAAVEDADARLRRIERDLHDGTQARLVAVAMQLGEAQDLLATGGDATLAAELLDTAHTSTKEALTELREIARGIHPPALDDGLAIALETLAARVPLPVTVHIDPALEQDSGISPAVRSIAYFTVAELLTNAVKHANATRAYVLVEQADARTLHVRVRDDGRGGAVVITGGKDGHQTGLSGLAERVATVDGQFHLNSPEAGPTVIDIYLPTTTA